ncbi:MAG: NADH-quinone oxidoreductase subunit D [Anaerolineae bacterium]|nr:NADH-quinone oxidoreductase subunit D [Anaerolineae bacterium]
MAAIAEPRRLDTETVTINIGPHHPSTHGIFRMLVTLDGETVVDLEPKMGYLHRGIEKLMEERTYIQSMPLVDRLDYVCPMTNEQAFCVAIEKLAQLEVPERAEYIRVMMAELTRIMSHMMAVGFLWNELGATFTPMIYAYRQREFLQDLFEMASGARMFHNYIRPGGVVADLPSGWTERAAKTVDSLSRFLDEFSTLTAENEIFLARTVDVGVLPPDVAVNCSVTGPVLRASGVPYDVRRVEPYSIYDRFEWEVPTQPHGDTYDRYRQYQAEMQQSLSIVRQALAGLPEGPVMDDKARRLRPPAGEAYGRIESPKGDLGFFIVSEGGAEPYRCRVRSTAQINLTALRHMVIGHTLQDLVIIFGSLNPTVADIDR